MTDLGKGEQEPCPHCKQMIDFDAWGDEWIFYKPVPCPHCGAMVALQMDEVQDERTGDWDWSYWFEKAND